MSSLGVEHALGGGGEGFTDALDVVHSTMATMIALYKAPTWCDSSAFRMVSTSSIKPICIMRSTSSNTRYLWTVQGMRIGEEGSEEQHRGGKSMRDSMGSRETDGQVEEVRDAFQQEQTSYCSTTAPRLPPHPLPSPDAVQLEAPPGHEVLDAAGSAHHNVNTLQHGNRAGRGRKVLIV